MTVLIIIACVGVVALTTAVSIEIMRDIWKDD